MFGLVYAALGTIGYIIGQEPGDRWELIPGQLTWGAPDHGVHILLGLIYLIGGLATRRTAVDTSRTATADRRAGLTLAATRSTRARRIDPAGRQ